MGTTPVETIVQTIKLLLPALIPSWRFFDTIAPSPRIEFTLLKTDQSVPDQWQEFRPKPHHLSITKMLKHLVWNPRRNETLYLVSCAERLMSNPTDHSWKEIQNRIIGELNQTSDTVHSKPYMQFRLAFLDRHGDDIIKRTLYTSPICDIDEIAPR